MEMLLSVIRDVGRPSTPITSSRAPRPGGRGRPAAPRSRLHRGSRPHHFTGDALLEEPQQLPVDLVRVGPAAGRGARPSRPRTGSRRGPREPGPRGPDRQDPVRVPLDHQGRDVDRGEVVPEVGQPRVDALERPDRRRAGRDLPVCRTTSSLIRLPPQTSRL